ncbi:hypothetical protein Q4525_09270 [Shimia thalassica]|uniref:hypothetical protein n=1 Tax=Shimia thalassica TaxID=1715693 RepID=UPI001C0884B1|nr:hypothetical protein [Shimia thalassica]MBU2941916.1 hypothetical protein [Shimia thalassica]MDO6483068.1 hypothetical protein [Shimia thalassica]MDO6503115.1 hypothetical protein [Shimia thalassica]
MPAAKPTSALIKRSIEAWLACGLQIGGVTVSPDGSVKILAPSECSGVTSATEGGNSCDALFGTGESA